LLRLAPPRGRKRRPQLFEFAFTEEMMTARSPKVSSKEPETAGREASPKSARQRMHAALEREADELTLKLIEKALAGDVACMKLCIERLYPPYKAAPAPPAQEPGDKTRVINLRIFENTGTAAGIREIRDREDEARASSSPVSRAEGCDL
jgi:hypothetical protein